MKSGKQNPDLDKVLRPFGDVPYVYLENNYSLINQAEKKADWYGVVYDNEVMDQGLSEAIPIFLEQAMADVLVCYKKEGDKMFKCPKFFKKHVKVRTDYLMPEGESCVLLPILDGWLCLDD